MIISNTTNWKERYLVGVSRFLEDFWGYQISVFLMRIHVLEKRASGEEDGEERKREIERESQELRGREEKRREEKVREQ